jgi:hypothetical protein
MAAIKLVVANKENKIFFMIRVFDEKDGYQNEGCLLMNWPSNIESIIKWQNFGFVYFLNFYGKYIVLLNHFIHRNYKVGLWLAIPIRGYF